MSKQETDPQDNAFPQENNFTMEFGLTKREYFAAMALQGLAGDTGIQYYGDPMFIKSTAEQAVDLAEALISALNEKEG